MDSSIYSVIFIVCIDYKCQGENNITQNGGNRVIERRDHIEIVTLVGPISKISLDVCSVYVEKCTMERHFLSKIICFDCNFTI